MDIYMYTWLSERSEVPMSCGQARERAVRSANEWRSCKLTGCSSSFAPRSPAFLAVVERASTGGRAKLKMARKLAPKNAKKIVKTGVNHALCAPRVHRGTGQIEYGTEARA